MKSKGSMEGTPKILKFFIDFAMTTERGLGEARGAGGRGRGRDVKWNTNGFLALPWLTGTKEVVTTVIISHYPLPGYLRL